MSEECYAGEIRLFAGLYAPMNWAFCNGQLLLISQNKTLFALLGSAYGGDGQTTFALPDLRSRVPVCAGQGTNLSPYMPGQQAGAENVTLNAYQLPAHTHTVYCNSNAGNSNTPVGNFYAAGQMSNQLPVDMVYATETDKTIMNASMMLPAEGAPISIIQPVLGLNYIICTDGLFPSRS